MGCYGDLSKVTYFQTTSIRIEPVEGQVADINVL
jgi:hypothetical protein